MTPFATFILVDGALIGLLVCSLISLFRTSGWPMLVKVAVAIAFGILACWQPLSTRAILGTPQPRSMSELPDRFQLLAEQSADDKNFDLWIKSASEPTPLAVTIVPDAQMRATLRSAAQKLGEGQPVFINRERAKPGEGHGSATTTGGNGAHQGTARTDFADDQTRWVLTVPSAQWRKAGEN